MTLGLFLVGQKFCVKFNTDAHPLHELGVLLKSYKLLKLEWHSKNPQRRNRTNSLTNLFFMLTHVCEDDRGHLQRATGVVSHLFIEHKHTVT